MTEHDDRKRRVRQRMAKTGESYTAARAHMSPTPPTAPNIAGYALLAGMTTSVELLEAISHARDVAVAVNADALTPLHLLAGLAMTPNSIASQALLAANVDLAQFQPRLRATRSGAAKGGRPNLSVPARTAFEFARDEHPAWQAMRRRTPQPAEWLEGERHRPLRTGHLLLGLIREGQVARVLPLPATLADEVRALLDTDREIPPRWSQGERFVSLPERVRRLLRELDQERTNEPSATGAASYARLASLLDPLPTDRHSQPTSAIWQIAKRGVRDRLDAWSLDQLRTLTATNLEDLLDAAWQDVPIVTRARRYWAEHPGQSETQ